MNFASRNARRNNGHLAARPGALAAYVCLLVIGAVSAQDSGDGRNPRNSEPALPHGRKVTIRFTAQDFGEILGTSAAQGAYEFAVRLTSDMRRLGASRAILPDPFPSDHKDDWMAAARHAATMGYEVRFEIDPAPEERLASDPQPSKTPGVLDAEEADSMKSGILDRVDELASLRSATGAKVASGFFVALAPPESLPSGWESGLDASTFSAFLKETGLEGDWGGRENDAAARLDYVKSRGLMPWLTWRSRRIANFYGAVGEEIGNRHALDLTVAAPHPGNIEAQSLYEEAERIGSSPVFAWRWMAFDPELWKPAESIRLIGSESVSRIQPNRDWATHPDLQNALGAQSSRGHWFAGRRERMGGEIANESIDRRHDESLLTAIIGHLSRHDSTSLIVDRGALGEGHEEFASWVARYEGLPEIGRKAWETVAQKPGLTMRSYGTANSELLVPINPLPCPVGLELFLVRREGGKAEPQDPDSNLKLVLERTDEDRMTAKLSIPPMHFGRLDLGGYRIDSYRAELPQESRDVVRTRYDALIRQSSGTVSAGGAGTSVPPLTESESKSRGRRLMAALQAYRDMRLADFFRISDSMTIERWGRRNGENPSDLGRADLPKRRLIR